MESLDSDDSYDELEARHLTEVQKKRLLMALERKYSSIRKAVHDDLLLFQDEIF